MKKEIKKVLITAIGCNTSISVAKCLKNSGSDYKIVGSDISPLAENPGGDWCDEFYQVPGFEEDGYLDKLLKISLAEDIKYIVSVMDREIEILSRSRQKFEEKEIILCLPSIDVIEVCNNKRDTYSIVKKLGKRVPKEFKQDGIGDRDFPLFIKPNRGVSSRDCYVVCDQDDLTALYRRVDDPIIQEFVEGKKFVIDVLNDKNGKNVLSIPREEYLSKAGIGVKAMTVRDKELVEYGREVSEALNIKGAANIEVFRDKNGLCLIEINPRFSAGVVLTCASGVNLPELLLKLFSGEEILDEEKIWREDIYMSRFWQEVYRDKRGGKRVDL